MGTEITTTYRNHSGVPQGSNTGPLLRYKLTPQQPTRRKTLREALSAWQVFFKDIESANFIYEYDLKNYFNKIKLNFLTEELLKYGLPKSFLYWFENVNRSIPKLTDTDRTGEIRYRMIKE